MHTRNAQDKEKEKEQKPDKEILRSEYTDKYARSATRVSSDNAV